MTRPSRYERRLDQQVVRIGDDARDLRELRARIDDLQAFGRGG